jgi:hypothetical protein
MNILFRDLGGIFRIFEGIYARIRNFLIPPRPYSWQTLLYLSIFSWIMSSFADNSVTVKDIISLFGWIFLIAATAWYTTDNPILVPGTSMPIGALVTGFLVSVFAFGPIANRDNREVVGIFNWIYINDITPSTLVFWPTISAIITAIPEFFEGSGTDAKVQAPKIEDRQKVILLLACSTVLSCWLQLFFLVNNWVEEYPSLTVESFRESRLISGSEPLKNAVPENGVIILNKLEPIVKGRLAAKSWGEVETWLKYSRQGEIEQLGREIIEKNLFDDDEKSLWRVDSIINNYNSSINSYKLDLRSIWTGPSANPNKFYLRKSCQIDRIGSTDIQAGETDYVAEVECKPNAVFIRGQRPPAQQG